MLSIVSSSLLKDYIFSKALVLSNYENFQKHIFSYLATKPLTLYRLQ